MNKIESVEITNPTPNFKMLCDEPETNIVCKYNIRGGFGDIYICDLKCKGLTVKIIKKQFKHVTKDFTNNELLFMHEFCATPTYKDYFAQLLFWSITPKSPTYIDIILGIQYYSSDLSKEYNKTLSKESLDYKEKFESRIDMIHLKVIKSIEKLHEIGRVHLDIKPANIFIDDSGKEINVVLGDFGLVEQIGDGKHLVQNNSGSWTWAYYLDKIYRNDANKRVDYAKFRDRWGWTISLCYLLGYFDNESILFWLSDLNRSFFGIQMIVHDFVHSKTMIEKAILFIKGKQNTHNEINEYIFATFNMCELFYENCDPQSDDPITPNEGGSIFEKIKYNNRIYKVYKNKKKEKYININKIRVLLSSISRKYRYIKNKT